MRYVYSYLSDRKQCLRINNKYSNYQKIKSGVPQRSILGPIFFNLTINDSFFFVSEASLHNIADDKTLSAFAQIILELIDVLQSGPEIVIVWLKNNKMIVNPDKLEAILLEKRKSDHTNQRIVVNNQHLKVVSSVELLGIQIDDQLNFNLHISNICRSAANQLNAVFRPK